MIHWFDPPYSGTNVASGFEVVIHGLIVSPEMPSLWCICINEDGTMAMYPHGSIAMDNFRYTRGKGWHSIGEPDTDG